MLSPTTASEAGQDGTAGAIRDSWGPRWGHRVALRSGALRVIALTAVLATIASALALLELGEGAPLTAPVPLPWWVVAAAFFLTEAAVIHLHIGRSAQSLSMTELPVVFGLFFLSPAAFLGARLLGAGLALIAVRRQRPLKVAFNLAQFLLSSVVALAIVHFLDRAGRTFEPTEWAVAFAATSSENVIGVLAVAAAISLAEGRRQIRRIPGMLATGSIVSLTNTSLALLAITVLYERPAAGLLLAVPLATAFVAYRAYISERQQHASLEMLYESTKILQRSPALDRALVELLDHARTMFRAETAELSLLPATDGGDVLRTVVGPGAARHVMVPIGPSVDDQAVRRSIAERRTFIVAAPGSADGGATQHRNAMVAPLVGETRLIGAILVADRLSDISTFDGDDLRLFDAVANHTAIALENGQLEQSLDQLSKLKEELHHQAYHDGLTGLANRPLFIESVAHRLESIDPAGRIPVVLFLDLDDFKDVNDSMGHAAGDLLLTAVGDRIRSSLREGDVAARLGGDEFGVLLWDQPDLTATERVTARLAACFDDPFVVDGSSLFVRASIGVAADRAGAVTADVLLRNADVAMYSAKASGKGRVVYFEQRMALAVSERHELNASLHRAIEEEEFVLHYQPVVDTSNGWLAGAEALLRWNHPIRGLLSASEFVGTVEESDLILSLGRWVLTQACEQLQDWHTRWPQARDLRVNVNVGARQLQQPGFVDNALRIVRDSGVRPEAIIVEVTESTLLADVDAAVRKLRRLRDAGLGISVDDFGTGYSSLSYLQQFPVTQLKIASPFVQVDETDPDAWALAAAIVALGRALRLEIIAEGVESLAQLERLRELGCQYVQGFYLARPLDAEGLERLVAKRAELTVGPTFAFDHAPRPRLVTSSGTVRESARGASRDRAHDSRSASPNASPKRTVRGRTGGYQRGMGAVADQG